MSVFEFIHQSSIYTDADLRLVQRHPVPKHVAIIPDGNRRWAKQHSSFSLIKGYWIGASIVTKILRGAFDLGIKVLTIYCFSTENWQRPKSEIRNLMMIYTKYLRKYRQQMVKMGIRFRTIGDLTPFPEEMRKEIETTCEATLKETAMDFVLAMNYGGRDEIRRVFLSIIKAMEREELNKDQITEETINRYLDTAPYGDPDLLIRTGGEERLSNFLLWQIAYTEVYMTDILWPDFTPRDLMHSVLDFQKRSRRRGR
ncbi:MAG: polyprenyl diphosphate synthase [Chlamydiales bacterium]